MTTVEFATTVESATTVELAEPVIDGTMRGVKIRVLPRLIAAVVFAALLSTGCTVSVSSAPAPQPALSPQPAPRSSEPPAAPVASCQVTATSSGSISSSGSGGGTSTINGRTAFSCGSGPMLGIETIADPGVTFAAPDGTTTTVAPGTTGQVGGYAIRVAQVSGDTAEFEVLQQ